MDLVTQMDLITREHPDFAGHLASLEASLKIRKGHLASLEASLKIRKGLSDEERLLVYGMRVGKGGRCAEPVNRQQHPGVCAGHHRTEWRMTPWLMQLHVHEWYCA